NVCSYVVPGFRNPESNCFAPFGSSTSLALTATRGSAVTVCTSRDEFFHITVWPALTLMVAGLNTSNDPVISTTTAGLIRLAAGDEVLPGAAFSFADCFRSCVSDTFTSHVVANISMLSTTNT